MVIGCIHVSLVTSIFILKVVLPLQHQALISHRGPTREQISTEHLQAPRLARPDAEGVLDDLHEGRLVRLDGARDAAQHLSLQFFRIC